MKPAIKIILMSIACLALAGCGNKGPLVRPSDIPASAPVAAEPAEVPSAEPASAPAEEPASGTPAARR